MQQLTNNFLDKRQTTLQIRFNSFLPILQTAGYTMPATAAAAAMAPAAAAVANDSTADVATVDVPTYIQVAKSRSC